MLASKKEQKVLEHLFTSASKSKPSDLFSEVLNNHIPDLSNYSWDKIIELRNHQYFQNFREKIVCLNLQISTNNSKTAIEIIDELTNRDIKEIINLFKPSLKNSIVRGIASNFPLPIPINPLSIYFSGKEIKRDIDISNKYGWLFFLIDVSTNK